MGLEDKNNIVEYYFNSFYRVIVLHEDKKYIVSVDVYYAGWKHDNQREVCVENTCLLVKEINPSEIGISIRDVEKIFVIGTRVNNKAETVNVKWVLTANPSREAIEAIYRSSWKIAGGELKLNTVQEENKEYLG